MSQTAGLGFEMTQRAVLKLSGEVFAGDERPFDYAEINRIADEIVVGSAADKPNSKTHSEIIVVIGGGNIIRGDEEGNLDRSTADQAGMMATIINGLILKEEFARQEVAAEVFIPWRLPHTRFYSRDGVTAFLNDGGIPILAGGIGIPYFTSDTAAVARALDLAAEVVFKAAKVDGIYDCDPTANPEAGLLPKLSFKEALDMNLSFLDRSSLVLCDEQSLPMRVFDMTVPGNIQKVIQGAELGTLLS